MQKKLKRKEEKVIIVKAPGQFFKKEIVDED